MSATTVAGLGFASTCTAGDIRAAIAVALAEAGLTTRDLYALAIPAFKAGTPAASAVANSLGLPLILVPATALAAIADRCPSPSAAVEAATGFPAIAEAAALASTGSQGRLLCPKTKHGRATCAVAISTPEDLS